MLYHGFAKYRKWNPDIQDYEKFMRMYTVYRCKDGNCTNLDNIPLGNVKRYGILEIKLSDNNLTEVKVLPMGGEMFMEHAEIEGAVYKGRMEYYRIYRVRIIRNIGLEVEEIIVEGENKEAVMKKVNELVKSK